MQEKDYDVDALVLALAMGEKTYAEIAAQFGLSTVYVGEISRGEKRPELQAKIEAATEGLIAEARRLGARSARPAMTRLLKLIADPPAPKDDKPPPPKVEPEVQRKAAVDILRFSLGDPGRTEVNMNQTQHGSPVGVAPEDVQDFYKFKADKGGGPPDEAPES